MEEDAADRDMMQAQAVPPLQLRVESLFAEPDTRLDVPLVESPHFVRQRHASTHDIDVLVDRFDGTEARAAFCRFNAGEARRAILSLDGGYQLQTCPAGGWWLSPPRGDMDSFWIPQLPRARRLDRDGHILAHTEAAVRGLRANPQSLELELAMPAGHTLDLVCWRLPGAEPDLTNGLGMMTALERQPYFLWSSHTAFTKPADLYLHLVHGHVYENHEVWPKYWRVCSELDAYGLYVTLTGLLRATRKPIYGLLRTQVAFSVAARQAADGGWYHGEWTEGMESHYRLHAGAMHLLSAYFEETSDPAVGQALDKAAAFAAGKVDALEAGAWYLHDSLEENVETLGRYPFRYAPSRALGKSPSNLLVLNTHLDTNIAMARYGRVRGDASYDGLIASANGTTRRVLGLRTAEWLYRPLYRLIGLTFLPSGRAASLPLPLRALKRLAWKYLIPRLPGIKARFPRLVMPGGYIERDLVQYASSVRYQPVNLMDLIRTRRLFGDAYLVAQLEESFAFTQASGIKARWKELKGKEDDSLGFWAEALYHLCLDNPQAHCRAWLAEAMIDLDDNGLGLSPSLLGGNAEAVTPGAQWPCPVAMDDRLRLANLGRENKKELLVVNPTTTGIPIAWDIPPSESLDWHSAAGAPMSEAGQNPVVPARGWVIGIGAAPGQ